MRKLKKSLLIKLHLYAGIFTSFYLLAFGLSTLILNHDLKVEKHDIKEKWTKTMDFDRNLPDRELGRAIRDKLGLMGWVIGWNIERTDEELKFTVTHPGRDYHIVANLDDGSIVVSEAPKGFIAVFHGLHFFNGLVPNAPFLLRTWALYQWLALFTFFVSLVLGLWLWIKYNYHPWEGWTFGVLALFTFIIMLLI